MSSSDVGAQGIHSEVFGRGRRGAEEQVQACGVIKLCSRTFAKDEALNAIYRRRPFSHALDALMPLTSLY